LRGERPALLPREATSRNCISLIALVSIIRRPARNSEWSSIKECGSSYCQLHAIAMPAQAIEIKMVQMDYVHKNNIKISCHSTNLTLEGYFMKKLVLTTLLRWPAFAAKADTFVVDLVHSQQSSQWTAKFGNSFAIADREPFFEDYYTFAPALGGQLRVNGGLLVSSATTRKTSRSRK
jgi:hypothetical protein